ncbi:MAG: Uma2 family endonuclease [Candidatus Tectomicrobia bacterium]|nr:Uma2 family endonuclease [Candidatus Tectomicrobia bacterium]
MATGQPTKPMPPPIQTDPPRSPRETLPTMYDLPSEDPEEPGLPDEFHYYQPQLLRETFQPPAYQPDRFFVATDLNLYYAVRQPTWYKRPDWFAVLGVSRLFDERDLRLSYVVWQEEAAPFLVVELLSPGTEREDLGETERTADEPPTKWAVYEQILRIPYYVVFSRYTDELHCFGLQNNRYEEVHLPDQRLWLPDARLGIGLWSGVYQGLERRWLRFYDAQDTWIPTQHEQTEQERQQLEQERQRTEQERQRAERLAAQLRALGIEPEV